MLHQHSTVTSGYVSYAEPFFNTKEQYRIYIEEFITLRHSEPRYMPIGKYSIYQAMHVRFPSTHLSRRRIHRTGASRNSLPHSTNRSCVVSETH